MRCSVPSSRCPHVVIDGTGKFDLLMSPCRQGIRFSEQAPQIHTIFVIAGSRDQRNFHLRALPAIAQIVQGPDFERQWAAARNEQALRDIVLLGQRRRGHTWRDARAPKSSGPLFWKRSNCDLYFR
ncbi:MAG: PTS sugar transporter subunit IIA [Phycisphaerales bacterium]|nr:MAG: PTS sugar transporter subunit IIA [Phycisphaerales bacterium]